MRNTIAAAAALLLALPIAGKSTSFFVEETREDFDAGGPVAVTITERGELSLSPYLAQLPGEESLFVWCLASDGKGNVYAGTGNKGIIYRIDPNNDVTVHFEAAAKQIMSLAVRDDGTLFAGSVPKGIVYRIAPDGTGEPFCVLEQEMTYIWALAPAPHGGVYVGSGYQGKIYRIDGSGKAETFLETRDTHFVTLVAGPGGSLYAGSAGEGIVYRVSADGVPTVLYDAAEDEVSCILAGRDGVIFAGTAAKQPEKKQPGAPVRPQAQQQGKKKPTRNSLYRIEPDGDVRRIFTVENAVILSLALDDRGRILVGTGNEGTIYRVDPEGRSADKVIQLEDLQVLAMVRRAPGDILIGTGNMGNLYRMGVLYGPEGIFTSQVLDAKYLATWGRMSWDADVPEACRVEMQTRSGNTEFEDSIMWSDWSAPYTNASGQPIESPSSRFIQYRAFFSSESSNESPSIRSVKIPYRVKNQPPVVGNVRIVQNGPSPNTGNSKKTKLREFERKISWSGTDPDGDTLAFDVHYRGEGETAWKVLDEGLDETSLVFDSRILPDGRYRVKVIVSDDPSNTEDTAETDFEESDPFVIDNTRPVFAGLAARAAAGSWVVEGIARDNLSALVSNEYSVDSYDWVPVYPADGVLDSLEESLSFQIRWEGAVALPTGEHTVILKAEDDSGNVGTGKVVFTTR